MTSARIEQAKRRLFTVTAAVTAIAVTAVSVVTWVILGGVAAAQNGTLSQLRAAGDAGGWRTISQTPLTLNNTEPGSYVLAGFTDVEVPDSAEPNSWLVQLTATAQSAATTVSLDGVQIMEIPAFETVTVSALVASEGEDSPPTLVTSAAAEVSASTHAYLVPAQENDKPSPGGTQAVSPVALINTSTQIGAELSQLKDGFRVSPLGLGDIPETGVAAVWVQGVTTGSDTAATYFTDDVETTDVGLTQGLTLVSLDERGLLPVRTSSEVSGLALSVVGWVAAPQYDDAVAVINTGLVSGAHATAWDASRDSLVANDIPTSAISLFSIQISVAEQSTLGTYVAGSNSTAGETGVTVTGLGTVIVAMKSGTELPKSWVSNAVWLGYFASDILTESSPQQLVIETPAQSSDIKLTDNNGEIVFSGVVTGGAGVAAVHIKQNHRYIGSAQIRLENDGVRWDYSTNAPVGKHTITVVSIGFDGSETSETVSFTVADISADDVIVAKDVVQLGAEDLSQSPRVSAKEVTFPDPVDVVPGDILIIPITEATPNGFMRRVQSVQTVAGEQTLTTREIPINELVLNADIRIEDEPLDTVSQPGNTTVPANTVYTNDPPSNEDSDSRSTSRSRMGNLSPFRGTQTVSPVLQQDEIGVQKNDLINYNETTFSLGSGAEASGGEFGELPFSTSIVSGTPGETPLLDIAREVNVSSIESLADPGTSSGQTSSGSPNSNSSGYEAEAGLSAAVSAEVAYTIGTRNYQHFELVVSRSDEWKPFNNSRLDVLEITIRQFEEKKLDFTVSGEFAISVGAKRAEEVQFDTRSQLSPAERARYSSALDELDKDAKTDKLSYRLGQTIIPLGPTGVMLWLSYYVNLDIGATLQVSGDVTISQSEAAVREFGSRYEHGLDRPKIIQFYEQTREPTMSASAAVTASVSVAPSIEFEIRAYEMLGGYIGLGYELAFIAGAETDIGVETTMFWRLEHSLDVFIGLRLQVFTVELFDVFTTFNLVPNDPPLAEGEFTVRADGSIKETEYDLEPTSSVSSGDRPLAIVVDISGSMNGERIEKAKQSMAQVIHSTPAESEIGIWSYPGAGGCSAGSFQVPMGAHAGTGDLLDAVQNLETGGGTPTGEALDAVAMELLTSGYTGASLLLVSDGESNCSVPACDVVEDIREMGFEISVTTVAFEISEAGREELKCIAEATGAEAYEVDDADDLGPLIEDLSNASVTTELKLPPTMIEGSSHKVEMAVHNNSARDAKQVQVLVRSAAGQDVTIWPSVNLNLGNIPPGQTRTQMITVDVGPSASSIDLEMTSWGANVAQTTETYSAEIVKADSQTNSREAGELLQEDHQLFDSNAHANEVIGIPDVLNSCLVDSCALDSPNIQNALRAAQEYDETSRIVATASETNTGRSDTSSRVIVEAYPLLFPADRGLDCTVQIQSDEALAMNVLIENLNVSLNDSVERARKLGVDAYFVSTTENSLQRGLTLCDEKPGVELIQNENAPEIVITESGKQNIETDVLIWSQERTPESVEKPSDVGSSSGSLLSSFPVSFTVDAPARSYGIDTLVEPTGLSLFRVPLVNEGQRITVTGQNYFPGSQVYVTLESSRSVLLGSAIADQDGNIRVHAAVPSGTQNGVARLAVLGETEKEESFRSIIDMNIGAPPPWWIVLLIGFSVLLFLCAIVSGVFACVRRRKALHQGAIQGETLGKNNTQPQSPVPSLDQAQDHTLSN